jgi:hypothetical protein
MRQAGERLFRRRIDHILAFAAVCAVPLAADEKFKIAIHDVLTGLFGVFLGRLISSFPSPRHARA